MITDQQPVYLCVLREYNRDYYSNDSNDYPLWIYVAERYVAARNAERAKYLFIEQLQREADEANNLHGEGTTYLHPIHDRQIEAVDYTGQWQECGEDKEWFLRNLITDPGDAHD